MSETTFISNLPYGSYPFLQLKRSGLLFGGMVPAPKKVSSLSTSRQHTLVLFLAENYRLSTERTLNRIKRCLNNLKRC